VSPDPSSILSLRDLTVDFAVAGGVVHAVRGVSLEVRRGRVAAVVGESGSGKSTVMLALMGLLGPSATVRGSAMFDGTELVGASQAALRSIRGRRISMVFQDPMTSLNPLMTVGRQLVEAVRVHQKVSNAEARDRSLELLNVVAIPQPGDRLDVYPHELSGGMRQRVMLAMAMANDPEVLIADEPTTALDVTIQAQILEVLEQLRASRQLSIVLVTHDLGVVAGLADSVHVMYAGSLVEEGPVSEVFRSPTHQYTRGLLACSPRLDRIDDLEPIPGSPPVLSDITPGCAFAPRCPSVIDRCRTETPMLVTRGAVRAACHVAAPGVSR